VTIRVKAANRKGRRRAAPPWWLTGTMVACGALGGRVQAADVPAHLVTSSETAAADRGRQPVFQFAIPAGELDSALAAFRQATGLTVEAPPEVVGGIRCAGVTGTYTAEQALRMLLSGTGVTHRLLETGAFVLEVRVAETVEVSGRLMQPASPKYTEPLRDIPQTITVVPQSVIGEQVATTLRDVLRNVSGISIQAGEGGVPAGDNLSIRGFSARTDVFVDGVRDFGGYSRDPYNVEQVEVAKGPSSSFGGRGSTGGSVNLVSKYARSGELHNASAGVGSDAYKRGTIDLNQPLAIGHGAARLTAMFTDADTPGRDEVTNRRWGVSPSLAFGLGTATRATLGYAHLDQDNQPDYGLPWVPTNTNPALAAYSEQAPPVPFSNYYGLTTRDYEDTRTDLVTGRIERDLNSALTLRALGRYGRTRRDSVITAPRFASVNTSTDLNRQLQSRDMKDGIAIGQIDLIARFNTGSVEHALASGLEAGRETSENFLRSGPTAPLADLFDPNPAAPYPGPITRTGAVNDGTADSQAAYLFDTVKLSQKWQVNGGLRWDRFDVTYDQTAVDGALTTLERDDDMVSGRAGIVFKPSVNASIYAGYGTSFNPSAEGLTLTAATVVAEPEKARSFELGTKWDLANARLSVTGAIFRTDKTNARTPGLNPGDPPTVLDGRQRVDGIEMGVTGRINRRWSVFGGYTFMDSQIVESNVPAEVGKPVPNTPRNSFSLWTTVSLPWELEVGGGAWYVGDRTTANTGLRTAPGYWVLDATAAKRVSEHLTLRLKGSNLADEAYIDRVGGGHFVPGPGRSILLMADVGF
jgi:catecholate siderophore receptor